MISPQHITEIQDRLLSFRDADHVAETFAELGIKGERCNSRDCPLQQYILRLLEELGYGDENLFVTVSRVEINIFWDDETTNETHPFWIVLPERIVDFLNRFDNLGQYAGLDAWTCR